MNEIWEDTISAFGFFQASSFGRVRSVEREVYTRYGKTRITKSNIVGSKERKGYLVCGIMVGGIKKIFKAHRLVAEVFCCNPYNKPFVNHIDGIKTNNHPSNLEWVTNLENMQHARAIGLMDNSGYKLGEENPSFKLAEKDLILIRKLHSLGVPIPEMAKHYKMSKSYLYAICRGEQRINANVAR